MSFDCKEFLHKFTNIRAVSGHEESVQEALQSWLSPFTTESIERDLMGSLWADLNPSADKRILLECHADEVGFIVRYIGEDGLLFIQPVGTQSLDVAVAQRVVIGNERGNVMGVVGTKPRHLLREAELVNKPGITQIWVDIGARNAREAEEKVALGDPVSLVSEYTELIGNRISAPALDNRAGMCAVASIFASPLVQKSGLGVRLLSSVQEEVGCRGAYSAIYGFKPDVALIFDVCHTSDTPGIDERLLGRVALGRGPVLVSGPNVSRSIFLALKNTAERLGIDYQVVSSAGVTSTDAEAIQIANGGVAVGIVAIPIRYMHTPNEILELTDLEGAIKICESFVEHFDA
ncbi:M20/M25/M40 family metallo-hydrolase [bacterium]|nr:M20/M25/M40 family metallo-hydrolase [bacterium]